MIVKIKILGRKKEILCQLNFEVKCEYLEEKKKGLNEVKNKCSLFYLVFKFNILFFFNLNSPSSPRQVAAQALVNMATDDPSTIL